MAWRLRLPLILGFVLGGIAISPFTPGPHLSDLHTFEVLAEVGVVLLMFSIGSRVFSSRSDACEVGRARRWLVRDSAHAGGRDRQRKAFGMEHDRRVGYRCVHFGGKHHGVGSLAKRLGKTGHDLRTRDDRYHTR